MPDLGFSMPMTVVLLGLVAAGSWGVSDFSGGLLGRRSPVIGVVMVTQGLGGLVALGLTFSLGEPSLARETLVLTIGAGVLAAIGFGCLYRGLAIGRMGVVAPVTAVLTAGVPAFVGVALAGLPAPVVLIGMVLAVVAMVVVSRSRDPESGRPSGLGLAIVGGLGLGLLGFTMSRVTMTTLFAPLAIIRVVEVAIFAVVIVAGRMSWRLPRASWPLAIGVGIVDLAGNAAFLIAARSDLATAAVVSSLYPIVTVLLAAMILRERLSRSHGAGVAMAGVAIAMIAGGSAA